jgi:hypothetical protein
MVIEAPVTLPILSIVSVFTKRLDQMGEELREIDSILLSATIDHLTIFLGYHKEYAHETLQSLFSFADALLASSILQKQIIGAKILSAQPLRPTKKKTVCDAAFVAWKETTNLGKLIVEGDLHSELISALENVAEHVLVGDLFYRFWERIEGAHSTERQKMIGLAVRAFKNMPEDEMLPFIQKIAERQQIENELPEFLVKVIGFQKSDEFTKQIIDVVIEVGCKNPDSETASAGMTKLAKDAKWAKLIIESCMERMRNLKCSEFVYVVLMTVLRGNAVVEGEIAEEPLDNVIVNVKQAKSRSKAFEFLELFVRKRRCLLNAKQLSELTSTVDTILWTFLRRYLEIPGISPLQDSPREVLLDLVKQFDFSLATSAFVQFLKAFMLSVNFSPGPVYSHSQTHSMVSSDYRLSTFPIDHIGFTSPSKKVKILSKFGDFFTQLQVQVLR